MGKFSSNIRFLLLREKKGGGSSFVQIMFLVAFGENWASLFANLMRAAENERKHVKANTRLHGDQENICIHSPV